MANAKNIDPAHGLGPASDAASARDSSAESSLPGGRAGAAIAMRLAAWAADTDDNNGLPFLIVDKLDARVFAFNARGDVLGSAPALLGLAHGDEAPPGIGSLKLSQMSADQRTTPAGRFMAKFGAVPGHGEVLWVDFRDGIALHPVMSVNLGEHRLERIKSPDPEQHRISYGCINVPAPFYQDVVLSALSGRAAVVYVLPDTKPMEGVFPEFAATIRGERGGDQLLAGE